MKRDRTQQRAQAQKQVEIEAAWTLHSLNHARINSLIHKEWLDEHLVRQKNRCAYCKTLLIRIPENAQKEYRATIDHVVALSKGGPDTKENTVAACAACNTAKGSMDEVLFRMHPVCLARLKIANTPPDRLSADPRNPYYDADAISRDVGVRFNGRERNNDVEEYSVSEGWILVPAGKSRTKYGRPVTVKLKGLVEPFFRLP
jgi:5-methylcytosine-specific restriction endonuclease McrA